MDSGKIIREYSYVSRELIHKFVDETVEVCGVEFLLLVKFHSLTVAPCGTGR
jgi:hypothetical protein